ncbi:cupin domain-containing protein [Spirulina major CS-329]|uniref:cupin domain-containing protein n=2 Tax=Spirulinaceae TaxID=1890448 RepID=UPI002330826E|nr:cupin domain-containing protein [Spirulina subsalsa]MDB9493462.1 cupin domain-containing protein [Spirulina subsalsa CS-330]MDB9505211.1 cupin domain-containing protein [Spirulina major CS-329]
MSNQPKMNKQDWIQKLGLIEHIEGGYFAESHRSTDEIPTPREGTNRAMLTSIYYLLTDDRPLDHLHQNQSDIMHYFHAGDPIRYILVDLAGNLERVTLGLDLARGEVPQLLVPGGYWKAAVLTAGDYGLLGEAVAPGFDYRDMRVATAAEIRAQFPELWTELAPYIKA